MTKTTAPMTIFVIKIPLLS